VEIEIKLIIITKGMLVKANNLDTAKIKALVKNRLKEYGYVYDDETSECDLFEIEQSYITMVVFS